MRRSDGWYARADLDELVDELLVCWVAELRERPNPAPRAGERGVAERRLLGALLRAAREETPSESALHALTLAASRYGALQPLSRVDPGEVTWQLACLRQEIARLATAREVDHEATLAFLCRVDAAISVASLAVIRGGHR